MKELRVHTRCEYTRAARCEGVASTHTLRGVTHRHTTHTLRLALLHRHPSLLRAKSEWSERITHAEKEASAASELCTRRKQVSESHTRRKKRAQRAKHTLETEASESHTRRKKRANHTDEKRGRRETQTPIVYSEHCKPSFANLCQSVPIPVDPGHCIPFYAIPVNLGHSMLFHAQLCQSEQSVPSCVNPSNLWQSVPFRAERPFQPPCQPQPVI